MSIPYKGKFTVSNPDKYVGDLTKIIYRSSWERAAFKWADTNPRVAEWSSEELVIHYDHPVKDYRAKYYPDLMLKMDDGVYFIIEIKPKQQTTPPTQPSRKTQKYLTEVITYAVNDAKWRAAGIFARKHEMIFEIWTEDTLRDMGIMRSLKLETKEKATLRRESLAVTRPKMKSVKRKRKPVGKPTRRS